MICGKDISTNNTHYNQRSFLLSRENELPHSLLLYPFTDKCLLQIIFTDFKKRSDLNFYLHTVSGNTPEQNVRNN